MSYFSICRMTRLKIYPFYQEFIVEAEEKTCYSMGRERAAIGCSSKYNMGGNEYGIHNL
jgi:hypothetical protein